MIKSWKTSVGGIILAVGQVLGAMEDPIIKLVGSIMSAIGAFFLGSSAKDNNVTGV